MYSALLPTVVLWQNQLIGTVNISAGARRLEEKRLENPQNTRKERERDEENIYS